MLKAELAPFEPIDPTPAIRRVALIPRLFSFLAKSNLPRSRMQHLRVKIARQHLSGRLIANFPNIPNGRSFDRYWPDFRGVVGSRLRRPGPTANLPLFLRRIHAALKPAGSRDRSPVDREPVSCRLHYGRGPSRTVSNREAFLLRKWDVPSLSVEIAKRRSGRWPAKSANSIPAPQRAQTNSIRTEGGRLGRVAWRRLGC